MAQTDYPSGKNYHSRGSMLQNIRAGLATNSSSSHSVVIGSQNLLGPFESFYSHNDFESIEDFFSAGYSIKDYYGWQWFKLSQKEEKIGYLISLQRSDQEKILELSHLTFEDIKPYLADIDHQSQTRIPSRRLDHVVKLLCRDDVFIIGGNDNDDNDRAINSVSIDMLDLRYDSNNDHMVVMVGNKLKYRIGENEASKKSSFPELMDLKITELCPFGCKFCYQSSTLQGSHADYDKVINIINQAAELGVMEIAFGGGEPSLHPQFNKIMNHTRSLGIKANVTTKNLNINTDSVTGIAFSVSSYPEYCKYSDHIKANQDKYWNVAQVGYHIVAGSMPKREIFEILDDRPDHVTLLGFKNVGFGAKFKSHDFSGLVGEVSKRYKGINIGIDTSLANQNDCSMLDPKTFYTTEGQFSMYVDAVKNTYGPSSYHEDHMKEMTTLAQAWLDTPIV